MMVVVERFSKRIIGLCPILAKRARGANVCGMKRLIDRIFYLIENAFVRSTVFQLLGVAALIVFISMSAGGVVWATTPEFDDFWRSVWWAFLRLTDPGYLGDDNGTIPRVVSTILTLLGYVLFLGALVAIMTTWLDRALNYLSSGRSHIFERDHILIIGWNTRMHALIEEVVHAKERVTRRLGRSRLPAIVILTEDYRSTFLADVRQRLKPDVRDQARLLIRSGNPLEPESLERVDFRRASSIILISSRENHSERHVSDITLVKILMTLRAQGEGVEPDDLPNLVVNINNPANKLLAESVGFAQRTEAIASDEFIGRLFSQSIRHPGMSAVYNHLLTDTWGESVFLNAASELNLGGKRLRDVMLDFEQSVPIGFLRKGHEPGERRLSMLALDERLRPDDDIISISPSIRAVTRGFRPGYTEKVTESLRIPRKKSKLPSLQLPRRRLLIVGWSHLIAQLLIELGQYSEEDYEVFVVTELRAKEAQARLEDIYETFSNISLTCHQAELHRPEEVARIEPETFDNITFFAPEIGDDPLLADAETVMAYVLVHERLLQLRAQDRVSISVELNDEDNRQLLRDSMRHDVIMTSEIVAHLLSQVAVRRALAWIYEELFTKGGPEIRFRRFERYFDLDGDGAFSFEECQLACMEAGTLAIGLRLEEAHGSIEAGTHLNPPRRVTFTPGPSDRLIVIEPEEGGQFD
jgi:hypothetical protein